MKVSNKDGIMLSQLYDAYQFHPDDKVTISKIDKNNFELKVNL